MGGLSKMISINPIAVFEEEEVLDTINKIVNNLNKLEDAINELKDNNSSSDEAQLVGVEYPTQLVNVAEKLNEVIEKLNKREDY